MNIFLSRGLAAFLIYTTFCALAQAKTKPPKNVELVLWDLKASGPGKGPAGKVRIRNTSDKNIVLGAVRLRFTDLGQTTLKATEWVTFKKLGPGKTRSRTLKAASVPEYDVLWLDIAYYTDSSGGTTQERLERRTVERVLEGKRKFEELRPKPVESFFSVSDAQPKRYTKEAYARVIGQLKKALTQAIAEDDKAAEEQYEDEFKEREPVAGEITFQSAKLVPGATGNELKLKFYNDRLRLPANRLKLTIQLRDDEMKSMRELRYTVPGVVEKGTVLLNIPGDNLPPFTRWQVFYTF